MAYYFCPCSLMERHQPPKLAAPNKAIAGSSPVRDTKFQGANMTLEELMQLEVQPLDKTKLHVLKFKHDLNEAQFKRVRELLATEDMQKYGEFMLVGQEVIDILDIDRDKEYAFILRSSLTEKQLERTQKQLFSSGLKYKIVCGVEEVSE